ncbi:MAG: nicotinamide riboside transporter PnuC [Thermoplasmata archaeon]|jgi:nicotinamide mononucleotide transporter|nr:nicotinamide riboside transporter PnuC [Thermoplasmata archaeon]
MNFIEVLGVATGLLTVWLTVKQKVLCWPVGIVNILLFMVLFYQVKLYADLGLQVVFLILSFYGWYYWVHPKKGETTVPVTTLTARSWVMAIASLGVGTVAMGAALATYTDASVPYWDSSTTVMSIVAQYLMSLKKLENWYLWIAADVIDTGIYLYKDLYLMSGLYAVFLVLATVGYLEWRKSWRGSKKDS